MQLVVDASSLFAAIIGQNKSYDLFFEDRLKLVVFPYLVEEFLKNKDELAHICGISPSEVATIFTILSRRMETFAIYKFPSEVWTLAEKLAPHAKDVPYFAFALHLKCGIWSRERAFKKQNTIKVYNTEELVSIFLE